MHSDELLYLPVSIGEAVDKLTILDIKLDKITDNRRNDVKNEYDILYEKLKDNLINYNDLYKSMKKVNLLIWDMMDILRDSEISDSLYLNVCKECIEYNDIRFRIKKKINQLSNSTLREQKSYKTNRLLIIINSIMSEDKNKTILNITRYFSFIYDEIIIESTLNLDFIREYFFYDDTICLQTTGSEYITYINKVVIDDIDYDYDKLYRLFNITEIDINRII